MMEKCVEVRTRTLGAEHGYTIASLYELAIMLKHQGRDDEAVEMMTKCLELHTKILGAEHQGTISSMHSLAIMWKDQGRSQEAVETMTRCVGLKKKVFGAEHERTKVSLEWLENWREEALYDEQSGQREDDQMNDTENER